MLVLQYFWSLSKHELLTILLLADYQMYYLEAV